MTTPETKPLTPSERYAQHLRAKAFCLGKAVNALPDIDEIDAWAADFNAIKARAKLAADLLNDEEAWMIYLAKTFGSVPAGAESSMRLQGKLATITVTQGNSTSIKQDAIADFRGACTANKRQKLFGAMFEEHTEYSIRKDAAEELRKAPLPKRLFEKLLLLYRACSETKKKEPSVKVVILDPNKPTKKPRAKKAVA